jgi:thiol:disulfide interchange protein DsbC
VSFIHRIIVAALLAIAAAAATAGETEDRLGAVLLERLPGLKIESIRKLPQADLYEVVHNGRRILYTDPDGKVGLFGNLIDLQLRSNLTEQRQNELNVIDFSKLPLDKAIKKVRGKGTRRMAVFTDPDCPFCKRLENELKNVDDVTIYVFLYPLEQLHPDAPRKARAVWCAPDPVGAWDALMMEGKDPPAAPEECKDPIAEVARLAHDFNIEGTPGIIFESGRLVPGAIGAKEIEELLGAAGKS